MISIQNTTDFASNDQEQVLRCAKMLSRAGAKKTLWLAIYHGKKEIKTVEVLSKIPGLSYKSVLNAGKYLTDHFFVIQVKNGGHIVGFKKIPYLHKSKPQILRLASDKRKREELPTKRNLGSKVQIAAKVAQARSVRLTNISIDDVAEFKKVRRLHPSQLPSISPERLPEMNFKYGVAEILGTKGTFQDWGGEKNDLFSTHVTVKGKRVASAFGFKGPATKGTLTPGKLGKNGDQIQRLFESPATAFFIQFEGQIAESVYDQMKKIGAGLSAMEQRELFYGIISLEDSHRLRVKYKSSFEKAAKKIQNMKTFKN